MTNAEKQARYRERRRARETADEAEQRRSLHRAATGVALAAFARGKTADQIIRIAWPDDQQALWLTRASTSPTSTSDYPAVIRVATLQLLAPPSAAAQLFAHPATIKLDFDGVQTYSIPRVGSAPAPLFVAEGAPAPAVRMTYAGTTCGPTRKQMFLAALSNELESATAEAASTIIGRTMSEAASKAFDAAVFSSVAADTKRPAGIFASVTPIVPTAGGGPDVHALAVDIGNMAQAIADAGISTADLVVVAGTAAATKLRLLASPTWDTPVYATSAMAANSVALIAPAGIASGTFGAPSIDTTKQSSAVFDDQGLPIVEGGTAAGPTYNTFQMDLLLLRVRVECAWVALPGSVQIVNGITW
jgi:hypothetical protein